MRIKITDNSVRHNIEACLEVLCHDHVRQSWMPTQKVFQAWLDRQTGQLYFDEKNAQNSGQKKCKQVEFTYSYEPSTGTLKFFIEENVLVQKEDSHALKILRDTMHVFQDISQKLEGPSDLKTKFSVLTNLHIHAEESPLDRNILFETWHAIDRMQAENLLLDKPVGTYLFRKDPYTEILEQQLEHQLGFRLKCFTLTYSKKDNQICDCTILHANGVWQIYDDDPSLNQRNFADLQELLQCFQGDLKYPLYMD